MVDRYRQSVVLAEYFVSVSSYYLPRWEIFVNYTLDIMAHVSDRSLVYDANL